MKTMKDMYNKLLQRREVSLTMEFDKNPGLQVSLEKVAGHFKVSPEVVAVKRLTNSFGNNNFLIEAFVYDSVDAKKAIEPKVKPKKQAGVQ